METSYFRTVFLVWEIGAGGAELQRLGLADLGCEDLMESLTWEEQAVNRHDQDQVLAA